MAKGSIANLLANKEIGLIDDNQVIEKKKKQVYTLDLNDDVKQLMKDVFKKYILNGGDETSMRAAVLDAFQSYLK